MPVYKNYLRVLNNWVLCYGRGVYFVGIAPSSASNGIKLERIFKTHHFFTAVDCTVSFETSFSSHKSCPVLWNDEKTLIHWSLTVESDSDRITQSYWGVFCPTYWDFFPPGPGPDFHWPEKLRYLTTESPRRVGTEIRNWSLSKMEPLVNIQKNGARFLVVRLFSF